MHASLRSAVLVVLVSACTPDGPVLEPSPPKPPVGEVTATDVAVLTGYVDDHWGWQRGRGAAVDDFDGDGRLDVFVGNPGDVSYLLMHRDDDELGFEPGTVIYDGDVAWGAVAGDIDDDGDPDLFVTIGGNENGGEGVSRLFRNDGVVDGLVKMVDVTESQGAPDRDDDGELVEAFHAGAFTWDADLDGDLDLFSAAMVTPVNQVGRLPEGSRLGLNYLWSNRGDGHFDELRDTLGMGHQLATRNAQALDVDNDGDLDLFENNWGGDNILWRNEVVPSGELVFTDHTAAWSLGGADLSFPADKTSQSSIPLDANQDGFVDVLVIRSGDGREPGEPEVHANGHLLFLNVQGQGFVEVADVAGLNVEFEGARAHRGPAAMGCTVGDVNLDGIPDVFVGKGNPDTGWPDTLLVSSGELVEVAFDGVGTVSVPTYDSWSHLIHVPSPADTLARHATEHAHYPYRTHAAVFTDFDGDGRPELGVHNGGPHYDEEIYVAEPNQLFQFDLPHDPAWLQLELRGDGVTVPRDAPHTRVAATVVDPDGLERVHHGIHHRGLGFGADPGPIMILGLGDAEELVSVEVTYTDGHVRVLEGESLRTRVKVER